jgi:foldase protein PrsA
MSKPHRIVAGITLAVLSTALPACSGAGGGGTIATVNGHAISRSDFDAKLESSQVARGVLQQMVQEQLLDQYATAHGLTVSSDELAKKEDQIKASFPAGSWDDMLKARNLTEADVQNLLRENILLDKAVGGNIHVSDAEVQAYFNKNHAAYDTQPQVKARHILVANLETANKVEAALKSGGDFAALAKQYSIDPGTKDKGGDLGFFRKGSMVPQFEAYAFSAPIGQISPPIKSPYGYHIIQVEARQPGEKATLANSRDKIVDTLRQQQEAPLMQPFIANLTSTANIQVNDPRFAGLFPSPAPSVAAPAAPQSAAPAPAAPAPSPSK